MKAIVYTRYEPLKVTGIAESGKSSLINDCFPKQQSEAIVIDRSSIGALSFEMFFLDSVTGKCSKR